MSTTPRRGRRGPTKGDRKEAAILDTAWALLGRQPLSTITVEDLAAGAGISRSAFYFYFDSRDAVVAALSERVATEIRSATSSFFTTSDDATIDDLRGAVAAYLDRWRTHGPVLRAMSALSETDTDLRTFWDDLSAELLADAAGAIERERAAGRALAGPPAAADLARVLFAMLWRTGYEISANRPPKAEIARLVETATVVIARALRGEPGAALGQPGPVASASRNEAEVLSELDPTTREHSDLARNALARHFDAAPADVVIVPLREDGSASRVAVILASVNGLKLGSWDEIFAMPIDEFRVPVGAEVFDTRAAVTWDVYRALIAGAKDLGRAPLPDSGDGAATGTQPWTCTLLTGERTDGDRVPFAFVNDNEPGRSWGGRDYRGGLRFRPVIVIDATPSNPPPP